MSEPARSRRVDERAVPAGYSRAARPCADATRRGRAGGKVSASLALATPCHGDRPPRRRRAIASGRRVILAEAEALRALADGDRRRVRRARSRCWPRSAGRVVVTGMGKSGHVARKIAATLASTGTPALYVHPAEASHGDLGMITPQDAVLALSNSGETTELRDLILYTRRFAIPLLGHGRPARRARSPRRPTSSCCCRRSARPARWAWRRPPRPPACWRWATRWRWRCSSGAASRRATSPCSIRAASSAASCCGSSS